MNSALDLTPLNQVPMANSEREDLAWRYLSELGCDKLDKQFVSQRFGNNLVCDIRGKSEKQILIGAHHDKFGVSHGIADNWSGVVVTLSLVNYFKTNPPNHTIRLVLFTGEEKGLVGSRHFVAHSPLPDYMVNLDTLGTAPLKLDRNSSGELRCLVPSGIPEVHLRDITGDWLPFRNAGVPVLAFHALNAELLQKLHTPRDSRSLINDDELKQSYEQILRTVVRLDGR
ncbi:MAG: M28 family peptidase [Pseudomonadales bacterium]|nr:M28 family peptidase [Pseudomonadales bacterium]MBO6701760.1 M28 family peptidase [Pseudomonadales bacterium]MBO7007285.1 M28 family peptidase [Pseudomonadales bacterium]